MNIGITFYFETKEEAAEFLNSQLNPQQAINILNQQVNSQIEDPVEDEDLPIARDLQNDSESDLDPFATNLEPEGDSDPFGSAKTSADDLLNVKKEPEDKPPAVNAELSERDFLKAELLKYGEDVSKSKASNKTLRAKLEKLKEIKNNEAHKNETVTQRTELTIETVRELGRKTMESIGKDLTLDILSKFGGSKQFETIKKAGKLEDVATALKVFVKATEIVGAAMVTKITAKYELAHDVIEMLKLFIIAKLYMDKFGQAKLSAKLQAFAKVEQLWSVPVNLADTVALSMRADL